MSDTFSPNNSPIRSPYPASRAAAALNSSGMDSTTLDTSSTVAGVTSSLLIGGSLIFRQGDKATTRSSTAAENTLANTS
jgi:hypothetical protein